jgi:hypothetical protein
LADTVTAGEESFPNGYIIGIRRTAVVNPLALEVR